MQNDDAQSKDNALSIKQFKAVTLLLARHTRDEVVKELEVSTETLYRWLRDPAFKEELARQQNIIMEAALTILRANMTRAAETLVGLLDEKGGELRRRVANDIISHVLKAKELEELEERLEQVERVVLERKTYRS